MTAAEMVLDLKAQRAAARQYAAASERLAERSIGALQRGKPAVAKALALYANDVRRWGKAECQ